jgi:hypothetical protein
MNRKGLNAMPALLKFLVRLAIFLSASHTNAFTSLSSVAGNQAQVNHLIRLQQPMRDPTNEPSHVPIREPTKRLGQDALLPGNLSSKRVLFRVSMMDMRSNHARLIQSLLNHIKWRFQFPHFFPF